MKHIFLSFFTFAALLFAILPCQAQIFSAVTPSGHTLVYQILNGKAQVTRLNSNDSGCIVTGFLIIPDTVTYNGHSYLVTAIGNEAFRGCSLLSGFSIPNSVTSIGNEAFKNCSSLTNITIPNSVTSIGNEAFRACNSLTNIVIPNSVTSFGFLAFESCSSLTNVTIPNSVTSIEQGTFMDCSSLANVTIPDSVFSIGSDAFRNCISLINIVIPNSVTSIGFNAFSGDTNMTSMVVSSDNPMYDSRNNCNAIIETATNTLISGCKNTVIPNSVTSIGDCAFEYCSSLTNVTIPNSVTSIGSVAFRGCSSLTDITIPNSVTSIGSGAFIGCVSFTSVTIPDSVTSIEGSTFWRCYSLTYVTIPNSVTSIGQGAFQDCSSLTNVTIPNSVTSIENSAFRGCSTLSSVTIPNSVTSIGNSAFRDCSIDTLNMGHIVPLALSSNNTSLPQANIIFIPCGATANYQNTWGAGNYHEPDPAILILSVLDNNGTAFIEPQHTQQDTLCSGSTAVIHATANYGYHFTQWNDGNTDNPRTITLTQDTSFAAQFAKNLYHIDGIPNFSGRGSVSGHDTVEYLDTVVLAATSNYGYHFSQWNDGNTDNPRYVTATQNLTFTAQFDYNQYSISLDVNDSIRGTASGEGAYNYLSERIISATPNYGYQFTQWNDGNTDNPRTITLTQDTSFTAQFGKSQYLLTAISNDTTIGSVNGGGVYEYLDTATITATTTAAHYHFVQWNDGVTDIQRTIIITQDLSLMAIFAIDTHLVAVTVNDNSYGTVSGAGEFPYGSTATLTPNPESGYYFVHWNNGDTTNPNIFTVTGDTLLTALFAPEIVPSICMVSVENDRNVLSWEKELPVSSYNIYREGITSNVYELLATIPYDSLSVWTDTSSRPRTRSYRYRLSTTDIYAHEADMSDIHKTMHLTISQGVGNQWNLVWTEYEGTNYTTYVIYRGSDASNIQQIDVMPSGGNTSYTDVNAPAGDVYYKVGIMLSSPCNPSKNNYMIMSNIATNSTVGIPANNTDNMNVFAHNGHVIINSSNDLQDVRIYDITGKLLKTVYAGGNAADISISDFAAGIYMVQIRTGNGTVTRKVVK